MYNELIRLFVGWIILCLPIYFILGRWKFEIFEKIIFTFFISYGIISLLVYWIGQIFNLKVGLLLAMIILSVVCFLWRKK